MRGVEPGRDFDPEWADVRAVEAGDTDPSGAEIRIEPAIEIGNIFKLGTRYSEPLGATYLDESGKEQLIWMGSYGIGPARIAAAAVEQFADEQGISWPRSLAPWDVELVTLGKEGEPAREVADGLYAELQDDRAPGPLRRPRGERGGEVRRRRAAWASRCGSRWASAASSRARSRCRCGAARKSARCRSTARRRRPRTCGASWTDQEAAARPGSLRAAAARDALAGSHSTRGRSRT